LLKARGVYAHIQYSKARVFGVLDGSHSKNVWTVAWVCRELGRECVGFWPRTVKDGPYRPQWDKHPPRIPQQKAAELGAHLISLQAGRYTILQAQARRLLAEGWPDDGEMLPNGLKLPETVSEVAAEVVRTKLPEKGTMVVAVGTGTIAAGVIRGLNLKGLFRNYETVLHLGYSSDPTRYIEEKSGVVLDGFASVVDEGYSYKDAAPRGAGAPFPANPYYELKAWVWLMRNVRSLPQPVVFWNGGD
jgi:hypothetical protein